ncbi:hypothetical protein H6P81_006359 [Aristolochia fimbriata]|uniref:CCHC-type domain-containing protein n=1 Tax=Aristolochia fimbriata TaxID=158543 RepID=A0AAV7EX32_ARIFI|nr:hypothetical protein H6P81_006359 [Aristolochia fimbriata]
MSHFYAQMSILWDQLEVMDPQVKGERNITIVQKYFHKAHLVQFLMALCNDFEIIRTSILQRDPLPSVKHALSELLAEEARRGTRGPLGSTPSAVDTVLSTPSRRLPNSSDAKSGSSRDLTNVKCNYCKEFGHMKYSCPAKAKKYQNNNSGRTAAAFVTHDSSAVVPPTVLTLSDLQAMINKTPTLNDIQDMINKAFKGLGHSSGGASALSASSGTRRKYNKKNNGRSPKQIGQKMEFLPQLKRSAGSDHHGRSLVPWKEPGAMEGARRHGRSPAPWKEPGAMERVWRHLA